MSAEPVHTWERYRNSALTPQQNKAVEMLYNGFTRPEICDELQISDRHLNRLFHNARKRGEAVPYALPGRKINGPPAKVSVEQLLHLRAALIEKGVNWGLHRQIAERVGMTENAVKVRLWKHDQRQGASQ